MTNGYTITRDKFLASNEVHQLLSVCEENAIVDTAKGRKTWVTRYMLIHLALNSGLRVSELAALKIADLNLSYRGDTFLIVRNGKGMNGIKKKRDVYLDKQIVRHLQKYIKNKKNWDEPIDDDSPLFSGRGGKHFTTNALGLSFKKALVASGLPSTFSIHSCRHSYATMILAKTNNIRFVQKQLGHASLNMTSLYANVLPEMNQSLANALVEE